MATANLQQRLSSMNPDADEGAEGEMSSIRAEIDASCRLPVMIFFASAVFWLLVGTFFGLIASIKLHAPNFLSDWGFMTFGRIRSVHLNAVAYGWASPAAIGVGIWLIGRLCRTVLQYGRILIAAGVLWNLGIVVGISAILLGQSTSIEWLEFPTYATFILFVAYAFVAVWAVLMFRFRRPGHIYVSLWYMLAAFFWFPWLYGVANIMLLLKPVQGSVQGIINWWYGHNALGLWFTPIGLATAYYLIPKVIGKPIYSYYLSILGFWSLALFYSWNGGHHLIGGPIPTWIQSASIVASVMMVIPVLVTAINLHMTMRGHFSALRYSPTLRFTVFGAMSYTLASVQGSSMALRSLNQVTHFTHYTIGHAHLGLYAFFSMLMFGAMYYIIPRLMNWEWSSARLIRIHFWFTAIGIGLMFGTLTIGGLVQGLALMDARIPFMTTVHYTLPFLHTRSLSGVLLAIGHVSFAILFVKIWLRRGGKKVEPTLFQKPNPSTSMQPAAV